MKMNIEVNDNGTIDLVFEQPTTRFRMQKRDAIKSGQQIIKKANTLHRYTPAPKKRGVKKESKTVTIEEADDAKAEKTE